MIVSFRSKSLSDLWHKGDTTKIDGRMHARILRRLDALNVVAKPEGMNIPGNNFHALRGFSPMRYTVHVNGPWCITFSFDDGDAHEVDLEQYH
jgi:toxin HigB-1